MTMRSSVARRAEPRPVPVADTLDEAGLMLARIRARDVEMAVWHRPLPPALVAWLERLPPDKLPHGRFVAPLGHVASGLIRLCNDARTPDGALRRLLIADAGMLAASFARIAETDTVRLRLEAIRDDACRRFHRDYVGMRLLTTYRGPGTQWVRPEHAADAIAGQQHYRGPIEQLPRHAVAIFKGIQAGNAADPAAGLVHRSPPIAGTAAVRLLLAIDLPLPDGTGEVQGG